jgi:hypothetical protein
MDGWGFCFSSQQFLCILMASNKSSKTTVMRERVFEICHINLNGPTKQKLSVFGWIFANFQTLHPIQTFLK